MSLEMLCEIFFVEKYHLTAIITVEKGGNVF